MAKLAIGALVGVVFGMTLGAACSLHAEGPDDETVALANEAGISESDLAGALNSQPGVDARTYLAFLAAPEPAPPVAPSPVSGRVACIIRHESGGDPNATNPRSHARGLGQFLDSTWRTTPQGKAGLSPYSASANLAAIQYMLSAGRALEFDAVRYFGC